MPTVSLSPIFNGYQAFSSAGVPLTFGTIETYQAGTSTPLATYTTAAGTVANANPITLLADGRPPQEIWLVQGSAYRFVLKDLLGNQIGTYDDIQGSDAAGTGAAILARLADTSNVSNGDALVGVKPTFTGATATTQHQINEERPSIFRWFTAAQINDVSTNAGLLDLTVPTQTALTWASTNRSELACPPGTYNYVVGALDGGNASLFGGPGFQTKFKYSGAGDLFATAVNADGIWFLGPGKATTAVGIRITDGFRNRIYRCRFDSFGDGYLGAGSGQTIELNYFINCGNGAHVIKYSAGHGNDPTTTFTSRKNWYENCDNGLWIDSTGATSGFISCSSQDDIFQLNTGKALRIENAGFPFTLINPHTEQNLNGGAGRAFYFRNSPVIQIGGFQAAGDVNDIDSLSRVYALSDGGIAATTPVVISNKNGTVNALKFDPTLAIPLTTIPAKAGVQKVEYVGGGYTDTTSARFDMYGGYGDNGFYYGNFIESHHNVANANGGILYLGAIQKGATDTYTRRVAMDYTGTLYPNADNTQPLGGPSNRWSVVYAGTGAINTSDERAKNGIEDIPDAWLDAWADVKWQRFKFNGRKRWHVGLIAQRVRDAFAARGLDAFEIGLLCYDEWESKPEELDADGRVIEPARPAGNRYGIRYEEALSMECALMRRRLDKLEKS